jgi:hypothetical protein
MTDEEPRAVSTPITIWGMTRKTKNPRPRCTRCGGTLHVARIDQGRVIVEKEKKVGRPRKGERKTRYTKIGKWCITCGIFYYPNGSPNYKLQLSELKKREPKKRGKKI